MPAAFWALAGCGGGDSPRAEQIDGQEAYAFNCGYCHDIPDGVGASLTAKALAAYKTVGGLDRYLRVAMPHEAPGSLADSTYDAILEYLLESRQLIPDGLDHGDLQDSTRLRGPA